MKYIELTVHTTTEASEIIADIMWNYTDYGVTICDRADIIALQTAKESTFWDYMDDELEENLLAEKPCIAIDTISIKVKEVICGDPYIFVPNAFSPNGDGNNDYFRPFYPDAIVTELYFAVYDRWGGIVYETDNIRTDGWDGTYKGKRLAPDVYVFWLKTKCINGEKYEHRGNVTLIR